MNTSALCAALLLCFVKTSQSFQVIPPDSTASVSTASASTSRPRYRGLSRGLSSHKNSAKSDSSQYHVPSSRARSDALAPMHSSASSARKGKGWQGGGVLKKVFRREKSEGLRAVAIPIDMESPTQENFVLKNLERNSPGAYFSASMLADHATPRPLVDIYADEAVAVPDAAIDKGSYLKRVTRNTFEKILTERLIRWSNGSAGTDLSVQCEPTGSLFELMRGQFQCDAKIVMGRIVFGNIRLSGGTLEAKDFGLNLYSFARGSVPLAPSYRYSQAFDLIATNATFTQDDLFESSCIRNGLRRLLTRILHNQGLTALMIAIKSIQVLPNGKVSCIGEATTVVGPPITFEVRSGIDFTSRGHILTFPGLEISLNPALGFFVPVIPEVTVDLGHNAQLHAVTIDSDSASMQVSARVTITPEHTVTLKNYVQSTDAYGASCSVDVGRWLTRIGRFTH